MKDLQKMASFAEQTITERRQLTAGELCYLMNMATSKADPDNIIHAVELAYLAGFTAGYRQSKSHRT